MADILDNIGASSESLSSLIPRDKREELAGFEMSLKQMIDEAKMLAESPPISEAPSMEDISKYRRSSDAQTPVADIMEDRRSRKSISQPESVKSVIDTLHEAELERERRWEEEQLAEEEEMLQRQRDEVERRRSMEMEEPEPIPMSRRVVKPRSPSPVEDLPPPPLEELDPPPVAPVRQSPAKPVLPGRGRNQKTNREPSVGADRSDPST